MKTIYRLFLTILLLTSAAGAFAQKSASDTCCIVTLSKDGGAMSVDDTQTGYLLSAGNRYYLVTGCKYVKIIKDTTAQSTIKAVKDGVCFRTDNNGILNTNDCKDSVGVPELSANRKRVVNGRFISYRDDSCESAEFSIDSLSLILLRQADNAVEDSLSVILSISRADSEGAVDSTFLVNSDNPTVNLLLSAKDTVSAITVVSSRYMIFNGISIDGKVSDSTVAAVVQKGYTQPVGLSFKSGRKKESIPVSIKVCNIGQDYKPLDRELKILIEKQNSRGFLSKLVLFITIVVILLLAVLLLAFILSAIRNAKSGSRKQSDRKGMFRSKKDMGISDEMAGFLSDLEDILSVGKSPDSEGSERLFNIIDSAMALKKDISIKDGKIKSLKLELSDTRKECDRISGSVESAVMAKTAEFKNRTEEAEKELEREKALKEEEISALKNRYDAQIRNLGIDHEAEIKSMEEKFNGKIAILQQKHAEAMKQEEILLDTAREDASFGKERFIETVSCLVHEISGLAADINRKAVQGTFLSDHTSGLVSSANSLALLEQKISEQTGNSSQHLSDIVAEVSAEIDTALNDSRSWINEAIRIYVYNAVPEIGKTFKGCGLSQENVISLVSKTADLLLMFGYRIDRIPTLFVTMGDAAVYDKESMDTCIQNIYPDFSEMLTENYVYDFFKIGYTKGITKIKTTVSF